MQYMNRQTRFRIIGIALVAVLCLAAVPAVSAGTYTLVSHTPDGYDAPLYHSGDTITFGMTGIALNDDQFTWNFKSTDLVLEDGYNTIGTTTYLPIGFAPDGTTTTTFITTGMVGAVDYKMSRNGGTEYSVNDGGAGSVVTHLNIGKGNYVVSATGTKSGSPQGIDWTIQGGRIASMDDGDPLYFTLLIPAHIKSGHLLITCTDNAYKGEGRQVFSYWYRIGEETPVTTETTSPVVTLTTVPEGPSDAGGGGAALGPQSAPLENGTFMMLKHDAAGNLIADYDVELDSTYGFKSNLNLARPLTVLDSYGKPVEEIKVNTIDPNSILDLTKSNVFTFSGFAVECEPPGTQFTNGYALLTVTLTDAQWAAALAAANGNTAAMSFKTYDETASPPGWVDVPTIVDPVSHTITAQISHFSMYGLFYGTEASTQTFGNLMPTTSAAQQAPVVTNAAQQAPTTSTTKSPALPGIVVIGVVGFVAYVVVRKNE
jgi:hypothetical protein